MSSMDTITIQGRQSKALGHAMDSIIICRIYKLFSRTGWAGCVRVLSLNAQCSAQVITGQHSRLVGGQLLMITK